MTHHDYAAFVLSEASALIEQLAQHETDAEAARRARDWQGQKDADLDGKRVRRALLAATDPSAVYLHGAATGVINGDLLRTAWQLEAMKADANNQVQKWRLGGMFSNYWERVSVDLGMLPAYSFCLSFVFTLAQPYLSKDDSSFYIIDNPIARDKVFRLPLVRPSSWKGSLRSALWQLNHRDDDPVVQRLFGAVNEAGDEGKAGRLFSYPTFFHRTSLEIINPHDRTRRVGKNPILLESVPDGSGCFTLLYVPFDRAGGEADATAQEVAADLTVLAKALKAMFTLYGFGAKTSSGFGLAQERLKEGRLTLRWVDPRMTPSLTAPTESAAKEALPRYMETPDRLKAQYLSPDGSFRVRSEAELKALKKADRQLYDKAKSWWERQQQIPAEAKPVPQETKAPAAAAQKWPDWSFASFGELVDVANQVAQRLNTGGAA